MADYYGSVSGFRDYHDARGNSLPPAFLDDDAIESALLAASEWLDAKFREQFPGTKTGGREQIREWPRTNAKDIHGQPLAGIPREIEAATYEAALIQGQNPGALSVNWTPGKYKSVRVEGAVAVEYASFMSVFDVQSQFAIVLEILSGILSGAASATPYIGESVRW